MAYEQMAKLYDKLMDEAPYDQWAEMTKEIVKQSSIPVKHIVDLGCGTGQITARLARNGYQMIGIDYSIDMLSYAEQRASEQNLSIQWINQDIRETDGISQVDAVVSYCDVINYITTEEELTLVFANVANMLKDDGMFIFDVHSLHHVEHELVNQTFSTVEDDVSSIWFCTPGEETGEMFHDLTFFVSNAKDSYSRFDEYHHQKTFSIEVYRKLLEQNGFQIRNIYGDFSLKKESLHEKTQRIFFITEKRSIK
ncbi:class I SAM-dependent DNA methyltransferase [Virgibacillus necropolis]|uniref:SAM-dependent methyltransferase n=1 Tax=Virgibacillus necropolis TaxID=163877 RepID=A0A221MC36_9BACI|nr:class I SAM-dependent methyltransferase [Virgibacillus necropolis]ASN05169.1 SAM-dependent methyltransferase [Virgibacillus necropolis]